MKGKWLFYHNELTYRPQAKTKPAAYVYPIKCTHKRYDIIVDKTQFQNDMS